MSNTGSGSAQYNKVMGKMSGRYVHQKETAKTNSRSSASRQDIRTLRNDIGAVRYESTHQFQAYNRGIQDTLDMANNLRATIAKIDDKGKTGDADKEANKIEEKK